MPSLPKSPPTPTPVIRPRATLPALQLLADGPRVKVFLSEADAVKAIQDAPQAEAYDAFGRPLTIVQVVTGSWMLRAGRDGDPDALRARVLDLVRHAAGPKTAGEPAASESAALIAWLDAAPDFRHFLYGLGLAAVRYLVNPAWSDRCRDCSWLQKAYWGRPPCC